MAGLVLMIIAIAMVLGLLGYSIYRLVKVVKSPTPLATNYPLEVKRQGLFALTSGVVTSLVFIFLAIFQSYPLKAGEWIEMILGSILFGTGLLTFVNAFVIHYYGKEVPEKTNKFLFYMVFASVFSILIGLLLLTNSIADYIPYPLVNGINFQEGFTTPGGVKPNLAWYALCILSGAVLVYFICDHRMYVEYGKHGILESTFFVAFPAGIIGARVGYVIGEWNHSVEGSLSFAERVANGEWWSIFAVWEGGLTVISGALIGIVVGVLWFIWRNKKYSIWIAVDVIIPCILVAQAIGRWGNFFNAEVHGYEVLKADWWILPKIVANNAAYSEAYKDFASEGHIYLPLFYVEFLSNLAGYFLIRFGVGVGLKKYRQLGDLAFSYLIWYGLTRVILEPLRDTHYNMGSDGYWSWLWSIAFVLFGALLIVGNHIVRFIIAINKKNTHYKNFSLTGSIIATGISFIVAAALVILGAVMMTTSNQNTVFLEFNKFNNGLITLVIGLTVLLLTVPFVLYMIKGIKGRNEN